jgi:hypothetical protein
MNVSPEKATESIDVLIQACNQLEDRLAPTQGEKAHDWLFAIREVLHDMRRLNLALASACNTPDLAAVPPALRSFARSWLHEVIPHVQSHMEELDGELTALMPEADEETE